MEDKLKIISDGSKTEVYINGVKVDRLIGVKFTHQYKEIATLEIQQIIIPSSLKSD